jgi:VanZ family protein
MAWSRAFLSNALIAVISMSVPMVESSGPAPSVTANETVVRKPGVARRLWRYGPPIVWAVLIFIGSSDLLSSSHTSSFILGPLRVLFPHASEATLATIHFALRKLGHFSEYAILAWLTARALRTSSQDWLRKRWFWMALSFVVCYALFDEFRQSFVPSRTSSIYDSLIDMAGGLTALILIWIRRSRRRKRTLLPSPGGRESTI